MMLDLISLGFVSWNTSLRRNNDSALQASYENCLEIFLIKQY
jgi:hypothetical protein